MYEELVKRLRTHNGWALNKTLDEAADAIEELIKPQWIPFETRPMSDEEREYYSEMTGFEMSDDAVIYCSRLPEDGQEVLVCNKYGDVWQDIFCNDPDYGVGLETHGDMDGIVAWMPMPEPYKPEEET